MIAERIRLTAMALGAAIAYVGIVALLMYPVLEAARVFRA